MSVSACGSLRGPPGDSPGPRKSASFTELISEWTYTPRSLPLTAVGFVDEYDVHSQKPWTQLGGLMAAAASRTMPV